MTDTALKHPLQPDPGAAQRSAADPAVSVWVNASAGSGKTTVLTQRVTRLLLAGTMPEKILCLTYTRAGAAEMTNRITSLFSKWASCDENVLREDLSEMENCAPDARHMTEARRLFARVLACPGGLRIRTIHSFCQEILSRFPLEAGLPPHFALIDGQELDALKAETVNDLLRDAADKPDSDLAKALAVVVAAQGEHGFDEMLLDAVRERGRIAQALAQAGNLDNLVQSVYALLGVAVGDTPDTLCAAAMAAIPETEIRKLALWLLEGSERYSKRGRRLAEILAASRDARVSLFDDYAAQFLTQKNEPLATSYVASKDLRQKYPDIDALTLKETNRILDAQQRIDAAGIAHLTGSVLMFGGAFAQRLAARKAARAALDYDDLILFADELLNRAGIAPWILFKLDNGIDHILVDEAQDTSRAQWNIVQALTSEFFSGDGARGIDSTGKDRTLFVVGDEKQSIFSFQNADPQAFLDLREAFARRIAATGKELVRVPMHTSFRSAPAILRAVDAIFADPATRRGVSQEPVEHFAFHKPGSEKTGRVEVWPLLQPHKEEGIATEENWAPTTEYEAEHDPQADLAAQIARKIKTWIASGEILPGTARPITPGDIMILLRRRARFADLMVRALKTEDVPVTGVDRMHLVRQLPVMDLLAVLRFVLLPDDDLNLAALLRSPLLGFSEDQLEAIAARRDGTLWRSLSAKSSGNTSFAQARDWLAARLGEADFSTPFAFLSHLLSAPCPGSNVSGRMALWARLGGEAIDPIEELLNAAQNFTQSRSPSLQNFLHWLTQADAEIKRELDQNDGKDGGGLVRIMTVHASKGLEAPIVFLPDTVAVPRTTDIPSFQWRQRGEQPVPLFLTRRPMAAVARDMWQAAADRQMEEYRRLYYVALTRAEKRLYICGWQGARGEGNADLNWYSLAVAALRPEHDDHLPVDPDGPIPDIIVGDDTPPSAFSVRHAEESPPVRLPGWAQRPVVTPHITISPMPPSSGMLGNRDGDAHFDTGAASTPDAAFARGRIIHRLLQSLPDIAETNREAATRRFLSQPRHSLDAAQIAAISGEVGTLLADEAFAALWGPDSRAEVPLAGSLGGIDVFRQIDRLVLRDGEVWIVDYKTNRPPPDDVKDIPPAYLRQVGEYRILLSGIYPDAKVRTFLLWTYKARLMEVKA
jgi:ATP-dependent helicase/nuclease subunit A